MNNRQFSLTLANTSGATKNIALLPAYFDTQSVTSAAADSAATVKRSSATQISAAGFSCDAVIDDGTITTGVTATAASSKFKIRDFLRYILLNPTLLKKLTIASANTDAYEKTLLICRVNPTGNQGEEYIHLTNFFNVQQYNDDKIVVPVEMELSDEILMILPIDTARTLTITFHF